MLFQKYATCHLIFNSAHHLSDIEINLLKLNIQEFMSFYRTNRSDEKVTPKMHMMEDHIVEFVSKWRVGCGFFGEQGGESLHKASNNLNRTYACMKKDSDRLEHLMKQHLTSCHPTAQAIRAKSKKRNFENRFLK